MSTFRCLSAGVFFLVGSEHAILMKPIGDRSGPQVFDPTVFQDFVFRFVEWLAPNHRSVQNRCSAHRKTLLFASKNLAENLASKRGEKSMRKNIEKTLETLTISRVLVREAGLEPARPE